MIVTVSGLSGLRNAYVSVLSAEGSSEINGASRWLEAWAAEGLPPRDANATISAAEAAAARRTTASLRILLSLLSALLAVMSVADSHAAPNRFGPMREYPAMARTFAHLSDEAVVALVARSDEEALAELYDRFGRGAYGMALRVLRDQGL